MGSDESHLNVSLIVRDKVTRLCPKTTTFFKRKESRSGIEPMPFCLPALQPSGQNGSQCKSFCRPPLVVHLAISDSGNKRGGAVELWHTAPLKLQALVYDILPSTTAVFSYAIGSRELSANEQFFVGVQTVVNLLQTTQIKQGVSFIAANKVYTSTNKTTIVSIETELFFFFSLFFFSFFFNQGWMRLMFTCVLWPR